MNEYFSDIYKSLDANKLLNEFGTYGRYQMTSYVLCQLTNFFYAVSIFIMIFVNRKPQDFTCKIDDPVCQLFPFFFFLNLNLNENKNCKHRLIAEGMLGNCCKFMELQ